MREIQGQGFEELQNDRCAALIRLNQAISGLALRRIFENNYIHACKLVHMNA